MRLPDKLYNFLKWLALIALPATEWYVLQMGDIWQWADYVRVAKSITCTATFIGLLIGVSTLAYNKFVSLQNAKEPADSVLEEEDGDEDE